MFVPPSNRSAGSQRSREGKAGYTGSAFSTASLLLLYCSLVLLAIPVEYSTIDRRVLVVVTLVVCFGLQNLQSRLAEYRETTYAPDRGALDPAACIANEKAGGYWAPWLPDDMDLKS